MRSRLGAHRDITGSLSRNPPLYYGSNELPEEPVNGQQDKMMVKAPRSKGCRVCVQRRVKCDQTRPYCNRCRQANRECPGYGVRIVQSQYNVDMDAASTGDAPPSSVSSGTTSRRSPTRPSSNPDSGNETASTALHREGNYHGAFEQLALISIMAPFAYQSQLFSMFISSTMQPDLLPNFPSHNSWLAKVSSRATPSKALVWAIRAISISHFARASDDDLLLEMSRRIYGKALLLLNTTLQDPEESLSSNTLSAVLLLSFYEIFNCTQKDSWIQHAGGVGRLIQLRGPNRHRSGFGRQVFLACRYSIIFEAFVNRGPCFLETRPWRDLLQDIKDELGSSNPLLLTTEICYQEMMTCPNYLRNAGDEVGSFDFRLGNLQALHAEGLTHRAKLQEIQARASNEMASTSNGVIECRSSFHDESTFPTIYQYPNNHLASLHCALWAVLSIINLSIMGLEAKIEGSYDPLTPVQTGDVAGIVIDANDFYTLQPRLKRSPFWDAARTMGRMHPYMTENAENSRNICKSAEYMTQTPFLGPLYLAFSLKVALRMYLDEEEKRWVARRLYKIGEQMAMARNEVEVYRHQDEPLLGIDSSEVELLG